MSNIVRVNDYHKFEDNLIIVNNTTKDRAAAPHGDLYEILNDLPDGRRVLRRLDSNTVVVGGAITALENLVGVSANWKPSDVNTQYNIPVSVTGTPSLCLFSIGMGGSNLMWGDVIATDIKQHNILEPIPIRYGETLRGDEADKYYLKKQNDDGVTFSWYGKKFAAPITIKSCWKNAVNTEEDGTEIVTDISTSKSTEGIETFAEIEFELNEYDGREYFEALGKLTGARYNTIGFYTGVQSPSGEFGNVRLYSVVNVNNRDLSLKTSGRFLYRIYSMI